MKKPKVIVKHPMLVIYEGNYYLVNNDDELGKIALMVLSGRFDDGRYGFIEDYVGEQLDYTREDIKNLSPKLQELALSAITRKEQHQESFDGEIKYLTGLMNLIENKDGRGAWDALVDDQENGCGEYIDLVEFERVK